MAAGAAAGTGKAVYDAIPKKLPPNVASLGYEATSTAEFGDYVHLGDKDRQLQTVTVTLSDWALYSDYQNYPRYVEQLDVDASDHGRCLRQPSRRKRRARPAHHVRHPDGDDSVAAGRRAPCPVARPGGLADGQCYNGIASTPRSTSATRTSRCRTTSSSASPTTRPTTVPSPIHQAGPYNSLNVGIDDNQAVTRARRQHVTPCSVDSTYPVTSPALPPGHRLGSERHREPAGEHDPAKLQLGQRLDQRQGLQAEGREGPTRSSSTSTKAC